MATVPNQKKVVFAKKRPWDRDNPFARLHVDAMQNARKNLKAEAFILWLAISSWDENSSLELSCQYMINHWGFAERSYHRARNELLEKGYLIPSPTNKSVLIFHEDGTANLAVRTENGDQPANLAASQNFAAAPSEETKPYENDDNSAKMAASTKNLAISTQYQKHDFTANLAVAAEPVIINDNKTRDEDIFVMAAKMAAPDCQNGRLDCQIDQRNTTDTTDKQISERKKENEIVKLTHEAANTMLSTLTPGKDYKIQKGFVTILKTNITYELPRV